MKRNHEAKSWRELGSEIMKRNQEAKSWSELNSEIMKRNHEANWVALSGLAVDVGNRSNRMFDCVERNWAECQREREFRERARLRLRFCAPKVASVRTPFWLHLEVSAGAGRIDWGSGAAAAGKRYLDPASVVPVVEVCLVGAMNPLRTVRRSDPYAYSSTAERPPMVCVIEARNDPYLRANTERLDYTLQWERGFLVNPLRSGFFSLVGKLS